MKLEIIRKNKSTRNRKPHYILDVHFMAGDADGFEIETLEIEEDKICTIHTFLFAIECCNAAYPDGRGGCDEYSGLLEYDAFFSEGDIDFDYYDEDEETVVKKINALNPDGFYMEHPCDHNYNSTSFAGYDLFYVDQHGDKFPVKVILNERELKRVKECNNFGG